MLEVIADRQKSSWRKAKDSKQHDEKFITKGLWGISRHPKFVFVSPSGLLLTGRTQLCWRGGNLGWNLGTVVQLYSFSLLPPLRPVLDARQPFDNLRVASLCELLPFTPRQVAKQPLQVSGVPPLEVRILGAILERLISSL